MAEAIKVPSDTSPRILAETLGVSEADIAERIKDGRIIVEMVAQAPAPRTKPKPPWASASTAAPTGLTFATLARAQAAMAINRPPSHGWQNLFSTESARTDSPATHASVLVRRTVALQEELATRRIRIDVLDNWVDPSDGQPMRYLEHARVEGFPCVSGDYTMRKEVNRPERMNQGRPNVPYLPCVHGNYMYMDEIAPLASPSAPTTAPVVHYASAPDPSAVRMTGNFTVSTPPPWVEE